MHVDGVSANDRHSCRPIHADLRLLEPARAAADNKKATTPNRAARDHTGLIKIMMYPQRVSHIYLKHLRANEPSAAAEMDSCYAYLNSVITPNVGLL